VVPTSLRLRRAGVKALDASYGTGMLLGAHVSAAGGIDLAIDRIEALGGEALQLFTQSPRRWQPTEHDPDRIERFLVRRREAAVRYVVCHAPYLINLATSDRRLYVRSRDALLATIDVAVRLEADVVIHVGSHGKAPFERGLARVARALGPALERATDETHVLLENTAGGGGTVGRSIEELAAVIDVLDRHERLGLCLDTAHLWASGVDVADPVALDDLAREIDRRIGLGRLRALHVNDTPAPQGSNRDVHANIGHGVLGKRLGVLLGHPAFTSLPAILETPGRDGRGPDATEMRRLRRLCAEHGIALRPARRRARRRRS
jgi:deoxyribonuclease IV